MKKPAADICLLLEGTYPYVRGGVSTWVHQLIQANPDLTFAIFHIGAQRDPEAKYRYDIPSNVRVIEEMHLFDRDSGLHLLPSAVIKGRSELHEQALDLLTRGLVGTPAEFEIVAALMREISRSWTADFDTFWRSRETWKALTRICRHQAHEESFLHFYWTSRYLIEPVWRLARAMRKVPLARVYHTACTGYAGLLGAALTHETGAPLILSEHGIYLRERIQDICRSKWIPEFATLRPGLREPLGTLRQMWISFFEVLGRFCYNESTRIISLFENNAAVQRHFGADARKIEIIPNGINTAAFEPARQKREERRTANPQSHTIGFLGRVVSIKDVMTLLRAARLVCDKLPDANFLVIGPTEEEPEYYQQCLELRGQLSLTGNVEFPGSRNPVDAFADMDVMVLTSISEGLPFVVLESLASGVPIVSTDVGACRELLDHRPDQPATEAACGILTEIGNATEIAQGLLSLLCDHELNSAMSAAGLERVKTHYHESRALGAYRQLYDSLMQPREAAAA